MFKQRFAVWEKISTRFVLIFCFLIGLALTYWAGCYSNVFPEDYSYECTRVEKDFLFGNIIAFLVWCVICMIIWRLLARLNEEKQGRWIHGIVIAMTILTGLILFGWLQISQYVPLYDQDIVYNCSLNMAKGNYNCMANDGGYMYIYPYQLDITFVYQVVFRLLGCDDFVVIQYLNILSIMATLYFGYRIVKEITNKSAVQVCYIMFAYTFVPLFMYSGFVYGDVISIGAATIAVWAVLRWCSTRRKAYAALTVWNILIGCLMRKTFYIILSAIAIGLLYYIVKNKCWRSIVLFALCIVIPLGCSQLIKVYYEYKSGVEVSKGLPFSYRISSALQESEYGAGGYNPQLLSEFYTYAELDYDVFDKYHREKISNRLKEFSENPDMVWDFFKRKIMEQWNDYTFSGAYAMVPQTEEDMTSWEHSVFYGKIKQVSDRYMNYYMFILYLGMTISVIFLWKQKAEVHTLIPLIAMIGGFLFSMIWENMGRYVLPYVILIQPFAAVGIGMLVSGLWENYSAKLLTRKE